MGPMGCKLRLGGPNLQREDIDRRVDSLRNTYMAPWISPISTVRIQAKSRMMSLTKNLKPSKIRN
jgi:hypothetical protein